MKEIFYFDSMLTPKIITVIYWFMLLAVVISGVSAMFFGEASSFLGGLGIIIAGVVFSRIWCEILIVLFKINENLQKVANRSE
jgi:hypothetical protein